MPFRFTKRIPYYFTDKSGVIHHANFFRFFEDARTEMFRELGLPYSDVENSGYFLVVVRAQCRYLGNAQYDDMVTIDVSIKEVGMASITLKYLMFCGRKRIAEGETKLACVDESKKPSRLPSSLLALFKG